jgi:hypothetical protein
MEPATIPPVPAMQLVTNFTEMCLTLALHSDGEPNHIIDPLIQALRDADVDTFISALVLLRDEGMVTFGGDMDTEYAQVAKRQFLADFFKNLAMTQAAEKYLKG